MIKIKKKIEKFKSWQKIINEGEKKEINFI